MPQLRPLQWLPNSEESPTLSSIPFVNAPTNFTPTPLQLTPLQPHTSFIRSTRTLHLKSLCIYSSLLLVCSSDSYPQFFPHISDANVISEIILFKIATMFLAASLFTLLSDTNQHIWYSFTISSRNWKPQQSTLQYVFFTVWSRVVNSIR